MKIYNLKLCHNFQIDNITQRKIAIFGGTGTGKTTTLMMIASELLKEKELKVVVFDALNVVSIEGYEKIVVSKAEKSQGQHLGEILNNLVQKKIIIGFKDFLQEEQSSFLNDVFKTFTPHNAMLLFDELHEFTPEMATGGKYAIEVERSFRHDRNNNVGFIFDSQRPAFVKKNIVALTDCLIVYRMTWANDLDVIKAVLSNGLDKKEIKSILNKIQNRGFLEGFLIDFTVNEKIKNKPCELKEI